MGEAAALLAVGHVALAAADRAERGAGGRPGRGGGARAPRSRPHGRGARARGPVGARPSARATRRSSRPSRSGTSSAIRSARHARSSPLALALPGERGAAAAREAEARLRELGARPQMRRRRPQPPPPRWPSRRSGAFACCATGVAGPALGVALAQGARPAEDARRPPRAPGLARRAHRGAVARGGPRPLRQPPVGGAQHAARRARPRAALRRRPLRRLQRRRRVAGPRPRRGRPRGLPARGGGGPGAARRGPRGRGACPAVGRRGRLRRRPARGGPLRGLGRRGARAGARHVRPRWPAAWPPTRTRPATTTARCASCCASSSATPTTRRRTSRSCIALVDAGRHGEARRAFRVYRGRMDEVGVEPASFPASTPV